MEKELTEQYCLAVNELVAYRLKVVMLAGTFLYVAFSLLDLVIYPAQVLLFLKIRLAVSACLLATFGLAYLSFVQTRIIWFVHGILAISALGICLMIYNADGSRSSYYEGLNLVVLAFLITNSFQPAHLAVFGIAVLGMYTLSVAMRDSLADVPNYINACFFMISTLFFSTLMAWMYGLQHRKQFDATDQLKKSEAKLEVAYQMVKTQAEIDDLTKVYNRRAFMDRLQKKIAYCRSEKRNFWLIIVDIDRFKEINDTYGHLAGDQAIQAVAKAIEAQLRRNTYMGRYGGDEFVIVMDEVPGGRILSRLEEIRAAIRCTSFRHGQKSIPLSASFGAAEFLPEGMAEGQDLLRRADQALLKVKETQRGEIRLAD